MLPIYDTTNPKLVFENQIHLPFLQNFGVLTEMYLIRVTSEILKKCFEVFFFFYFSLKTFLVEPRIIT